MRIAIEHRGNPDVWLVSPSYQYFLCFQGSDPIAITKMSDSNAYPISVSSLHFPSAEQATISQTLSSLRRSALSVTNRLHSIELDAQFVQSVADHYGLPLVANERCGSWYINPDVKAGSAYFKSTDGHTGQWDFSSRRLNLQVLSIAREHGGFVFSL